MKQSSYRECAMQRGRHWVAWFVVFCGVGSLWSLASAAPPNIVFIFSDDHALRALGAYGSGLNQTPHIDRIAREGVLFERSYCGNSICCPSRATILTGKHSHKNGVLRNGSQWNGDQFVFSRALSAAGYRTALFGKWHLRGWPTDEFDEWQVLEGAGGQGHYYNPEFLCSDGRQRQVEGYSTDIITDVSIDWMNKQSQHKQPFLLMCQYKSPHIHRIPPPRHMNMLDGHQVAEPATLFDTHEGRSSYAKKCWMRLFGMSEHVLNITPPLGEYDDGKHPYQFLGRMTHSQRVAFHEAYDSENKDYRQLLAEGVLKGRTLDRYKYQRFMKDYLGCVAAIDDNVGRILDWLDSHGLAENTLVVYSSDQGFFTGEHGWNDKRWMYEQSLSMPLLMRWPAVIRAGTRVNQMVQILTMPQRFLMWLVWPYRMKCRGSRLFHCFGGNRHLDGGEKSITTITWIRPTTCRGSKVCERIDISSSATTSQVRNGSYLTWRKTPMNFIAFMMTLHTVASESVFSGKLAELRVKYDILKNTGDSSRSIRE